MAWDLLAVADEFAAALARAEAAIALEQAPHGLDAKSERDLQGLLASGLRWEVAREVHYPSSLGNKLSHRQRCDLVLAPGADALWVEMKIAYQFAAGGRRHHGYSAQWSRAFGADLKKMAAEPAIRHAALAVLVFNESEEILRKDLELFENLLVRNQVAAGFRQVRTLPIGDRIGHRICSVALWPAT